MAVVGAVALSGGAATDLLFSSNNIIYENGEERAPLSFAAGSCLPGDRLRCRTSSSEMVLGMIKMSCTPVRLATHAAAVGEGRLPYPKKGCLIKFYLFETFAGQ